MALITLVNQTKLKSLKFGGDRPQGGSSNEPFIQSAIPASNAPLGQQALSAVTSILAKLPGITDPGIGLATQASLTDAVRLGKFFTTPQGLLFTAKQNLLSRISVRTEASGQLNDYAYLPGNTLAQAGVGVFGGHLNKQGINPFLGFGNAYTPDRYFDVVRNKIAITTNTAFQSILSPSTTQTSTTIGFQFIGNPASRGLIGLPTFNNAPIGTTSLVGSTQSLNNLDRLIQLYGDTILQGNPNDPILLTYPGGPGSILGVGKTLIRYATGNTGAPLRVKNALTVGVQPATNALYAVASETDVADEITSTSTTGPSLPGTAPVIDFRRALRNSKQTLTIPNQSMAATKAPAYSINGQTNLEARVNLNNPAAPGRSLSSYVNGTGVNSYDIINAYPLYRSEVIPAQVGAKVNDLVKFRIAAIDNDNPKFNTYMHFRAFLGSISDSYNADWDSVQYMGRGDKLYSYKGFGRSISLSWTVAAQSKAELIPMYRKLNYLASNLAPDYNVQGYMRGPLVYLTIGGYLYEVPGFITALSYELGDDVPWEVGITDEYKTDNQGQTSDSSVKELPHIIKVTSFNFTPIHRFIPSKQQNVYGGPLEGTTPQNFVPSGSAEPEPNTVGAVETYGTSRFISLAAGSGLQQNNYDKK